MRFEQAVYGSFPFWDRGYAVLARSAGCRAEWLAELRAACQRYGEPPRGVEASGALLALRLTGSGRPWMVVGVGSPGADDRGRPGALSFHALFVPAREFRKVGFDPFALRDALRLDWGPEAQDRALPPGFWRASSAPAPAGPLDPEQRWAVERLASGRKVVRESAGPIDGFARSVWRSLPESARRRASVATLAFSLANGFDLVAVPRLAGVAVDRAYATFDPDAPRDEPAAKAPRKPARRGRRLGLAAVVGVGLLGLGLVVARGLRESPAAPAPRPPRAAVITPPDRTFSQVEPIDADEQARVTEGLLDLAERFGALPAAQIGSTPDTAPTALMLRLADRLRYRGPLLSPDDLDRLAREPSPERATALAWHRQVSRFVPDRPLPADFARGPLRWQLDTLAWSFHLEPDSGQSAAEVPHALAEALAVAGPVRPLKLGRAYPPLEAYVRFLENLPRR